MSDFIPDGWSVMEFDQFTTLQRGKDLTKGQFREGSIPVAGSNGIIGYHDTAIARGPGITVGRSGSVGKVTFYEKDFWPHNTSLFVSDFHGNDPGFARYLLTSLNLARFKTGASVPTLDRNSFKSLPVLIPPLLEQKAIAHILSTVQRAIEAQERIIQTTTELKKALMQKLFTEGLRGEPQKETEIGLVPESWEVVPLGDIAKVGNGSTPKRSNVSYWDGGIIPWLNSSKIHDLQITEGDQFVTQVAIKDCHLPIVKANSLLIAITGQGKTLGNSAICRIDTCINQHLAYAQFYHPEINPDYILWYMQTRYEYLRSIAHGGGSTKGALTCGFLKTILIPLPANGEQLEITSIFQYIERKLNTSKSRKRRLEELLRTLLRSLISAEIRINTIAPTSF
jgi:type I restriction enzyme S subunit